jgi:hypothetical protein
MTGTQLSLFPVVERAERVYFLAPPAEHAGGARQALPGGYAVRPAGEYFHVYHAAVWLGSIYHLGGKMWNLYFPNERGVCGFGGPGQQGAAAELHRVYSAREAGLPY